MNQKWRVSNGRKLKIPAGIYLLKDAYLGSREVLQKKLLFLANMAQEEKWDYKGTSDKLNL